MVLKKRRKQFDFRAGRSYLIGIPLLIIARNLIPPMIRKLIVTVLMMIFVVPVNAVAAASMAVSISTVLHGDSPALETLHARHSEHAMTVTSTGSGTDMIIAHDHNVEDCDDYCMSCSNHCSSSGIVSSSKNSFERDREFEDFATAHTLSRAYLLFRPPIRA